MLPNFKYLKFLFLNALCFLPVISLAQTNCVDLAGGCRKNSYALGSGTSASSQIRLNPSAVPTDDIFGIVGIQFKTQIDVMFAKGNGRVGAAISPANIESTFFGPPSMEVDASFLQRKNVSEKYKSQKVTLATAVDLYQKNGSGLKGVSLKLGLMGKYNRQTKEVLAGAGLTGSLGALSFGYSLYNDETELNYSDAYGSGFQPANEVIHYKVQTYNVGLYLNSLILDYSNLRLQRDSATEPDIVNLYTASLLVGRFIVTASRRIENSLEPSYNYGSKQLEYERIKEETFGGLQVKLGKHLMIGALYNYYLLREYSVTMTLFF